MFVNVQVRIYRKKTKNKQKPAKTSTRVERVRKSSWKSSWALKSQKRSFKFVRFAKFTLKCNLKNWQEWPLKFQIWHVWSLENSKVENIKYSPCIIQTWQERPLLRTLESYQNQSLENQKNCMNGPCDNSIPNGLPKLLLSKTKVQSTKHNHHPSLIHPTSKPNTPSPYPL